MDSLDFNLISNRENLVCFMRNLYKMRKLANMTFCAQLIQDEHFLGERF